MGGLRSCQAWTRVGEPAVLNSWHTTKPVDTGPNILSTVVNFLPKNRPALHRTVHPNKRGQSPAFLVISGWVAAVAKRKRQKERDSQTHVGLATAESITGPYTKSEGSPLFDGHAFLPRSIEMVWPQLRRCRHFLRRVAMRVEEKGPPE